MRAPTLPVVLLLAAPLVGLPGLAGCDTPGGGLQSGDVTSYGVDAGGTTPSSDENLFRQLLGTGAGDTEPTCVGADCPPPPDPGPEPVCKTPLPASVAVATQCQTLCQKLVACTGSAATTQGPCATECNKSMTAVAPDVLSAAMGCYLAASCEDIKAAMEDGATNSTEPAPAPGYPADMDAGSAYAGSDASGAPQYPREDPMPEPTPAEGTALQQCLDSNMESLMAAPLAGADQAFCDNMSAKQQECYGAPRPQPEPQPGGATPQDASGSGWDGDWYCTLMAHLLSDAARDRMSACYALPCDQVQPCLDDLEPCLHMPVSSSADSTSGSGSTGNGTAEPSSTP